MRGAASSALARGIRWRLMGSLLVVITTAIAVGTAIVGPLFLRAGADSLVRQAVADASASKTRFELTPTTGTVSLDGLAAKQRALLEDRHLAGLYGPSVVKTMVSTILATARNQEVYLGRLTYRSGICSVVHFSAGGCGVAPNDAIVSDRSARALGVTVGSTVPVDDRKEDHPAALRITGVYRLPDLQGAYWFGEPQNYFLFGQNSGKPLELDELDDLFVASPAAFALPAAYPRSPTVQSGLRPGKLGIGNAASVMRAMLALKRSAALAGFQVETALPAVLSAPLRQRSLMSPVVVVAAVQLVLLAMWVLTSALMRSGEVRRTELRVAGLRGFPLPTLLAVSITEPAALCAVGVVLGVLGGWVVVLVAASILLTPGTTVALDAWTLAGFGAVVLTICAVLGLSSARLLRGFALAGSSRPWAASRFRLALDVSIIALSAVALLGAATAGALSSHSNPVAAAAPAVVALGTSVIAIRIVEYVCRRLSAATLDTSAVALFLAVRQVGRRPTALREARTLVIAVALACFAVSAWSVARANRVIAATFSIGARTVVTGTTGDQQLVRSVDSVDPRGRFAMAAIQISGPGTPVIGVDATRLSAVAAWPGGTTRESVAAVSRALRRRSGTDVRLAGGTLAVSARVSGSGEASRELAHLYLAAWLFDRVDGTFTVDLGSLRAGTSTYQSAAHTNCPCRLVGLGVLPSAGRVRSSGAVHLAVSSLTYRSAADPSRAARAGLLAADWRSSLSAVRVGASGGELSIDIPMTAVSGDVGYGGRASVMASLAGPPSVLPAVAGGFAESLSTGSGTNGTLSVQGLDGYNIGVRPAVAAASLPRIGPGGVIVDLATLESVQTAPTFSDAHEEVWLGPQAPADAVARLRAAGLQVDHVERSSTLISQARHTGPALAYDFMLLATLVALLVAAVGTFSVLAAGGRGRATELVALEVAGVRRAILARSLAIEAGILALTALFGVVAGAGSAAIALPSLPQLAAPSEAPLSYALPAGLLLAAAASAVLVVVLATALATRGILNGMSPTLLRNAADDVD